MHNIYFTITSVLWIILAIVWLVGRFTAKKIERQTWNARQIFSLIFIFLASFFIFSHRADVVTGPIIGTIGVIISAASVFFAIWARFTLGRNWSGIIALKEHHQLVTGGPYRFVRHPIYTGFFGGFIGFALVIGGFFAWCAVPLVFIGVWLRIPAEEKLMTETFPDQYPAYRKKTKAIIPFIF